MSDGFALSVPYHASRHGLISAMPLQYDKDDFVVRLDDCKNFEVNGVVKLSCHMTGFVHFSSGGSEPIISGYCKATDTAKGAGLRSSHEINVTTGPLCGVRAMQISQFQPSSKKDCELFSQSDLWKNPNYGDLTGESYNIEIFMFDRSVIHRATLDSGKVTFSMHLPFKSRFIFPHEIRVIEKPRSEYVLGVIVSRMPTTSSFMGGGFAIGGPAVFTKDGAPVSLNAIFPRPFPTSDLNTTSLNYLNPSDPDVRSKVASIVPRQTPDSGGRDAG